MSDTEKKTGGPAFQFASIRDALQADEGYAWSWQCNLAMAFYDSWTNENRPADIHRKANEGAARFMYNLFGVDVKTFEAYKALEKDWGDIPETVAMTPVATYDGVEFTRYTLGWLNGMMPEGTVLYAPKADVDAKRLTTLQMLASIPTADQVQNSTQEQEMLTRSGTEGREQA